MKARYFTYALCFTLAVAWTQQRSLSLDDPFHSALFPGDSNNGSSLGKTSLPDIFVGPLFPEDSSQGITKKQTNTDPEALKRAQKERLAQADSEMRSQIQKVASWLREFSMRNQNRFPGTYGDTDNIQRASQVQLTELVGTNPYAQSWGEISDKELSGLSPGMSYYFNQDGTPVTGSPLANDEWNAELSAQNANRIQLDMDRGTTIDTLNSYRTDPPLNWAATPGTIVGMGNGQGFLYVWGAGADGKPLRTSDGKVYIVYYQTGNTVDDIGQQGSD